MRQRRGGHSGLARFALGPVRRRKMSDVLVEIGEGRQEETREPLTRLRCARRGRQPSKTGKRDFRHNGHGGLLEPRTIRRPSFIVRAVPPLELKIPQFRRFFTNSDNRSLPIPTICNGRWEASSESAQSAFRARLRC
jgi:hypothetical protein